MNRITPSISPRLEFFVTDAIGSAVPSLTHANVTSVSYVLATEGVRDAGTAVALTGSVASTAAKVAGQFVTIDSARGHYAVDCPAGAALSTANSVELSVVMADGTQEVWPVSHEIDVAVSSLPTVLQIQSGLATSASISALNNLSSADVNAQVLDVLSVDTFNELAAPPAANSSLKDKITWLFMWARNKATESLTQRKLYADDTTTVVSTEAVSETAGVFTKGEQV